MEHQRDQPADRLGLGRRRVGRVALVRPFGDRGARVGIGPLRVLPGGGRRRACGLGRTADENIEGSAYQAFTLLHRAREAVEADSIEAATAYLQRVIDADSPGSLQDLARVRLARLHQQGGDSAAALAVLAGVRGSGYRGLAQELKGDIHVEQGERALAHEAYRSARQEMGDDRDRPILDIKINDTAPPEQPEPQSAEPEPELAEPEPQPETAEPEQQPESAETVPE